MDEKEKRKNSLSNSEERELSPEEVSKMIQEAETAAENFREYRIQREMEEQAVQRAVEAGLEAERKKSEQGIKGGKN